MRVLIAAASRHGSTFEIAEQVGRVLSASGLGVDVRSPADATDVAAYGAFVVGSAIYYGGWLPSALAFVRHHEDALARVPVWLFSVGALVPDRPPTASVADLLRRTHARGHRQLRGALASERLGWRERLMVSLARVPYGDFRDWTEVRSWAHEIAAEIGAASDGLPVASAHGAPPLHA